MKNLIIICLKQYENLKKGIKNYYFPISTDYKFFRRRIYEKSLMISLYFFVKRMFNTEECRSQNSIKLKLSFFNFTLLVSDFTFAILFYSVFRFLKDYPFTSNLKSVICKLVLIFYISFLKKHRMYYFSKLSLIEISSLLCMNMKRIYNKEEKKLMKCAEEQKKV